MLMVGSGRRFAPASASGLSGAAWPAAPATGFTSEPALTVGSGRRFAPASASGLSGTPAWGRLRRERLGSTSEPYSLVGSGLHLLVTNV
jgi:hypothetical protein